LRVVGHLKTPKNMITKSEIEIYNKYGGLWDGIERVGTETEREIIKGDDWSIITGILKDLELMKKDFVQQNIRTELIKYLMKNLN